MTRATIQPPDSYHVSSALGWLELGNVLEASAELAKVSPEFEGHPDVLEIRWMLSAKNEDWEEAMEVAARMIGVAPEEACGWLHRAYAARRIPGGGVEEAWHALKPAATLFDDEPTIPYNLACYACQMGRLEEAREWITKAMKIGGRQWIRRMALDDDDLKPLWDEIREG